MPRQQDDGSEEDPSIMAFSAQKRIFELKRVRETRLAKVVAQSEAALADIQVRLANSKKQKQQKSAGQQTEHAQQLIESVERRKEIEEELVHAATSADRLLSEVEGLMMKGYEGREKDALRHISRGVTKEKRS